MDGGMATVTAADGPRATRVVITCDERVVGALSVGASDGMDRRDVEHVKAHGGHLGGPGRGPLQPAERARKQLVPRPEQGQLAVDPQRLGGETVTSSAPPDLEGGRHRRAESRTNAGRLLEPRSSRARRAAATTGSEATALKQLRPSRISTPIACPASSLAVTLWDQVAYRSVQASTTNQCGPIPAGDDDRLPFVITEGHQFGLSDSGIRMIRPSGERLAQVGPAQVGLALARPKRTRPSDPP